MNTISKFRTTLVAAALTAGCAAQAAEPVRANYANELERCVAALRVDLQDANTLKLRYTVTDVARRGVWYEFDIRSEVFESIGGPAVRATQSHCRSHRWSDATQITG